MNRRRMGGLAVAVVGAWLVGYGTAHPQDTTSLLTSFLIGLRNGTIGDTTLDLEFSAASGVDSEPSYAFAADAAEDTGMYLPTTNTLGWTTGGQDSLVLSSTAARLQSGILLGWSSGDPVDAGSDTTFGRDAAGVLALTDTLRLVGRATAPATPASGQLYMDTTAAPDELCFYDGTGWQGLSSGTDANCA